MKSSFLAAWEPRLLSVLRIFAGALYMEHGLAKLVSWPAPGPAHLTLLLIVAGCLETFGGFLILIGWFTRPVAFLLAGEMAIAYFTAHMPRNFFPLVNGGDAAVLFCFIFLYLAAAGGGVWSVDATRRGAALGAAAPVR